MGIVNSIIENLRANEYLNFIDPQAMSEKFFEIISAPTPHQN